MLRATQRRQILLKRFGAKELATMVTVWMQSFGWEGLNEILRRPAAELAKRLAHQRRRKNVPYCTGASSLPQDESELTNFLETLLAQEDWFEGKSPRDAKAVDGLIAYVFHDKTLAKPMKLSPLSDGASSNILNIATGYWMIDGSRDTARSRYLQIKKADTPLEANVPELVEFGARPFRHPAWDRQRAAELLVRNNPFIHGADAAYSPDYSIHSPEQAELLLQDLRRVGDRVHRELGRVKSKRLREGAIANFEEDLVAPIEKAAGSRRAIAAWQDY